jgi:tight adherence protein C
MGWERIIMAILVFGGVLALYVAFDRFVALKKRRSTLRARIGADGMIQNEDAPLLTYDREPSMRARNVLAMMERLGINVAAGLRHMETQCARAGIASPDAPIYLLFMQRVGALGFVVLGLLCVTEAGQGLSAVLNIVVGGLLIIVGVFGPKLYIENIIQKRKAKLIQAFPDTLDLLLICTESGLALDAAMNRVCAELGRAYPEMTAELNRTRLELALLNDRSRALSNLAERTDIAAFRSLTAALIQSERFGTSLTDTLRVLSEDFRLQRLNNAENRAAKIPVFMTIPLIFLLMPAFLIIVLGPAVIGFIRDGGPLSGG